MSGVEAESFTVAWQDDLSPLAPFPAPFPSEHAVPEATRQFLQAAGLPSDAAPFLSFGPRYLDYTPLLREHGIDDAMPIGTDGAGNPIAVLENGTIVRFDHERHFKPTYVNSDVATLADCLLRYREMVLETQRLGGSEAFLDGLIPAHLVESFTGHMRKSDNRALDEGTFWQEELNLIEANRP